MGRNDKWKRTLRSSLVMRVSGQPCPSMAHAINSPILLRSKHFWSRWFSVHFSLCKPSMVGFCWPPWKPFGLCVFVWFSFCCLLASRKFLPLIRFQSCSKFHSYSSGNAGKKKMGHDEPVWYYSDQFEFMDTRTRLTYITSKLLRHISYLFY